MLLPALKPMRIHLRSCRPMRLAPWPYLGLGWVVQKTNWTPVGWKYLQRCSSEPLCVVLFLHKFQHNPYGCGYIPWQVELCPQVWRHPCRTQNFGASCSVHLLTFIIFYLGGLPYGIKWHRKLCNINFTGETNLLVLGPPTLGNINPSLLVIIYSQL